MSCLKHRQRHVAGTTLSYLVLWASTQPWLSHAQLHHHGQHHAAHGDSISQPASRTAEDWPGPAAQLMRALQGNTNGKRVVVVNDIPGHFEVLASVLHTLRTLSIRPHVLYVGAPNTPAAWGLLEWLGQARSPEWEQLPKGGSKGAQQPAISHLETDIATWQPLQLMDTVANAGLQADLVLCVSAELAPEVCRQVVEAVQPGLLAMVVHRADAVTSNARILSLYKKATFFALAPHVAAMAERKMHTPVAWALPVCPHIPARGACTRLACLHGFTIQGALRRYRNKNASGFTRNYAQLWQRLVQLKKAADRQQGRREGPATDTGQAAQQPLEQHSGGGGPFGALSSGSAVQVTVLGKGTRLSLGIPSELDLDVQFYSRLPYPEFWGRIHHSLALVPSLGHEEYYLSRITSTVVASLITSTPVIADQRLLDVYTFLQPQHVFVRQPGEDEAAAMHRIAAMPEEEVMSRRAALVQLRQSLNAEAVKLMTGWLDATGKAA